MGIFRKPLTILLALCVTSSLFAATIPWRQKKTFQFAQDIEIADLMRGFAALQGIPIVIDPEITGIVNGKFEDLSPQEFLDRVSRAHGLNWFYDGNVLHITSSQKTTSKFVEITGLASERLLETISNLGIVAPQSSIRIPGSGGIAYVSGPPAFVEMVSTLSERLSSTLQVSYAEAPKIRIFPLKYAWAYDTTISSQETDITIPGVATLLRGLMDIATSVDGSIISGTSRTNKIKVSPKIKTFKDEANLKGEHKREVGRADREKAKDEAASEEEEQTFGATTATLIQPDIRLNAIIVRDVEERMSQYEEVINTLDVPAQIIEISVAIIDINTNYSSSLGNNFINAQSINNTNSFFQFNSNALTAGTSPVDGFNFNVGSVVNGWTLLNQVRALSTDGHANIVARPSVLTLNNIEAELTRSQTFFVSLTGTDSSDLANVTAGTTLRVTPRAIADEATGLNKVKLLVSIEDGSFDFSSNASVSGLPVQSTNNINTQAVIYEGQSLLIGGYYRQEEGASESGIPILRNIPLLGYAFKVKTKNINTIERMFLITPRIVNLSYENSPDISDNIANFRKPPFGIAGETAEENFRIKHECTETGPHCHPPYEGGYGVHEDDCTTYKRMYTSRSRSLYTPFRNSAHH